MNVYSFIAWTVIAIIVIGSVLIGLVVRMIARNEKKRHLEDSQHKIARV